ncbi:MAG: hypothetical protein K8I02_04810 [Candidatus Methylomirabilis sp.]|nr:hypothetical protein [Deltaproteobacteria bacterium]
MPSARNILRPCQLALEELHDVSVGVDVRDFLVDGDPADGRQGGLLVRESPGEVEVALALRADVRRRLEGGDPFADLAEAALPAFAVAVEEVSHFVYLLWQGTQGRSVSVLETEVQAEVDKYACARLLWSRQGRRDHGRLIPLLFDRFRLEAGLAPEEEDRYAEANALGRAYCARLRGRHPDDSPRPGLLRDLRDFFRLTGHDKLNLAHGG